MKKIILFIFIPIVLFSCTSADKQKETTGTATIDTTGSDFRKLDTAIYFAGVWVNEKYVDKIKKTKSPSQSQDVVMSSCIVIPDKTLKVTRMISGFHEGAEDMVVVKNNDNYQFYDKGLTQLIWNIDVISPERVRINKEYFIKIRHGNETRTDLNILEDLLFSGKYKSANGGEVTFGVDGRVTGLDSFHYYNPVIDYTERPDSDSALNEVELGGNKDNLSAYGFKFDKDILLIYKLRCVEYDNSEKQCEHTEFGEQLYKLLRRN